jgi:hypothetical protein
VELEGGEEEVRQVKGRRKEKMRNEEARAAGLRNVLNKYEPHILESAVPVRRWQL